ncbi:MAG: hypothetical protein U9O82_02385 [Thermodesulfobacteriota bacterium]|nr:hypothetical protein [Thermodesulfobacteriota bacterium]
MNQKWLLVAILSCILYGCGVLEELSDSIVDISTSVGGTLSEPFVKGDEVESTDFEEYVAGGPTLIASYGEQAFVWLFQGRIFVLGSRETSEEFLKYQYLPYYKKVAGAGPNGEDVLFEDDKEDSALFDRLLDRYLNGPFLLESWGHECFVWGYKGDLYLLGSLETSTVFGSQKRLPVTTSVAFAGPHGENVIVETDPRDPGLSDRLLKRLRMGPYLLDSYEDSYFVWLFKDRFYVFGDPETSRRFKNNPFFEESRLILGAGPGGKAVVIEESNDDLSMSARLSERFINGPYLLETEGSDYHVWKYNGRIYVIGNPTASAFFQSRHDLPNYRNYQGAGLHGETVVVEVDPSDPDMADRLYARYSNKPISQIDWRAKILGYFKEQAPLIGEATVQAFSDKEKWQEITETISQSIVSSEPPAESAPDVDLPEDPILLDSWGDKYFVWLYQNRLYVLGSPVASSEFESRLGIPNSKVLSNAGPKSETVVFEHDPKNPELTEYLQQTFLAWSHFLEY